MIVVLFAGAGGSTIGVHDAYPDETIVGVEWDANACRTHQAAGYPTVRADVARIPFAPMVGKVDGVWASPPCPTFSVARSGTGVAILDLLAEAMRRVSAGDDCRAECAVAAYPIVLAAVAGENEARDKPKPWSWVVAKAQQRTIESVLVLEPARWAHALQPTWLVCEQVPAVLPLWRVLGGGADRLPLLGGHLGCRRLWRPTEPETGDPDGPLRHGRSGTACGVTRRLPAHPIHVPRAVGVDGRRIGLGDDGTARVDGRRGYGRRSRPGWVWWQRRATRVERHSNGGGGVTSVDTGHGQAPAFDPHAGPARSVVRAAKDWRVSHGT